MINRARWLLVPVLVGLLAACDSAEERADGHFRKGLELLAAGEPAKAQLEFRNTLRLASNHVEARYQIATHARSGNNIRGAVGQYRSIIELEPNHVPARRELAAIMLVANDFEEAGRHVEVAFAAAPDDVVVRAVKSSVDYKRGEREAGLEMARGVIAEAPENITARLVLIAAAIDAGDMAAALREVDAGIALNERDLSLNVVRLGLLEEMEDIDGLGGQLKRLVEYFPAADRFREAMARWYIFKEDFDGAEAQYRAIAANNPEDFQKTLDVARYLNAVHGAQRARTELVAMATQEGALVEVELAIAALDMQSDDVPAAEARLDAVIARAGDTLDGFKAMIERAKIHVRSEEWEATDALLSRVLAKDAKNKDALLLRASRWLAVDQPQNAVDDLRVALDVAPDDVQLMLTLATAYERNGNPQLAQERLAQAVQRSNYQPDIALRYAQSLVADDKIQVAESVLNGGLRVHADNRDLLVALGQIKLRQSDWRAATEISGRLRTIDPDDPIAERMEAASLLGQRRFGEGTEILRSLVAEDVADPDSITALVRALLAGGDIAKAEEFLRERLQISPDETNSSLLLSSLLAGKGELEEAERLLERVIEVDPTNGEAYASLARIYNAQGRSELVTATLARGLEGNEGDMSLRLTKAMQLEQEGDIDGALELYAELYRQRPNAVVIANNFASLLADHRAGDPAQLERAMNIARRFRDTTQPYLQDTYGWLLHLTGDNEGAMRYVIPAADALRTNPTVQFHAGMVLRAAGQPGQARQRLERAVELAGQMPFARLADAQLALSELDDAPRAGEPGGTAEPATPGAAPLQ